MFQDEIEPGLAVFGFEDAPFLPGEALGNERAGQRIAVDQDERFHFVAASVGSMIQKELPPSLRGFVTDFSPAILHRDPAKLETATAKLAARAPPSPALEKRFAQMSGGKDGPLSETRMRTDPDSSPKLS